MADDTSASIITLHQPRPKKATKTPAERAREYRQRKKAEKSVTVPDLPVPASVPVPVPASVPATVSTPVTPLPPPTVALRAITPSRRSAAPLLLTIAALALAVVGMTMNGWFARSLGSTDTAGWLFLVIGVAAHLAALGMPPSARGLWQAGQRTPPPAAWAGWLLTFVFSVTAGVGVASLDSAGVPLARPSRATPAVTTAQASLNDAMTARDREC